MLDEVDLGGEEVLERGLSGCRIELELVEIYIGRVDLAVRRIPLKESSSPMLLQLRFFRIGIDVDIVRAMFVQFLLVVDMGELIVRGLVGHFEIGTH